MLNFATDPNDSAMQRHFGNLLARFHLATMRARADSSSSRPRTAQSGPHQRLGSVCSVPVQCSYKRRHVCRCVFSKFYVDVAVGQARSLLRFGADFPVSVGTRASHVYDVRPVTPPTQRVS